MAKLSEQEAKLFKDKNFAQLVTMNPDGTPQVTPVWVDYDGEGVVVNTVAGRIKDRNMRHDPRVALSILNSENPYEYVTVYGTAEPLDGDAERGIDMLAKKYIDQDTYPWRQPGEKRVMFRVRPDRVNSFGF